MRSLLLLPSAALLALALGVGDAFAAEAGDAAALKAAVPGATIGLDSRFGTARAIASPSGRLSGAHGAGLVRAAALDGVPAADPHRVVKAFVAQYAALFGDAALLDHGAVVDRDYEDSSGAMRTVIWRQQIDGVPVRGARFVAHLGLDGSLIDISNSFVPGVLDQVALARAEHRAAPVLDAARAVAAAVGAPADALDTPDPADARRHQRFAATAGSGEAGAQLAWSSAGGPLRLVWEVTAKQRATQEVMLTAVDAAGGGILASSSLTRWLMPKSRQATMAAIGAARHAAAAAATPPAAAAAQPPASSGAGALGPVTRGSTQAVRLRVYGPDPANPTVPRESPTPMLPGWNAPVASPSTTLPNKNGFQTALPPGGYIDRVLISGPMGTATDPNNWIDDGGTTTVGNNVAAHTDWNATDPTNTGGPTATGAPSRDFIEPIAIEAGTGDPSTYYNASIVNAFYLGNFMHDRLWDLGFQEADGNFQQDNFGRGGLGGDRVQIDVQDGLNTGNSDNANFSTDVDGSEGRMQMYVWDSMSPRRDGDLDATVVCHEYTHGLSLRLVGGGGLMGALQSSGMGEGWSDFFALALTAPALSDPNAVYPVAAYVTLDWFTAAAGWNPDPTYQNYYQGVRRYPYCTNAIKSPLTAGSIPDITTTDATNSEVHSQGEIWCSALWQARANWLAAHASGTVAQYQAENDNFLKLIIHGLKLTPGNPTYIEARDAILRADMLDNAGANQVLLWQAFAKRGLGPALETTASSDTSLNEDALPLSDLGVVGGAFHCGGTFGAVSGQTITYTLQNFTGQPLAWTAGANAAWLDVTPSSGSIAAGLNTTVTVTLNAAADTLLNGSYDGLLTFSGGNTTTTRGVQLDITGTYVVSSVPYQWLGGASTTTIGLPNEGFVAKPMPFSFRFYGQPYASLYIGSNGLVSFAAPTDKQIAHTANPVPLGDPFPLNGIICPLWYNLDPGGGGTVTTSVAGSAPYRVFVITWNNVPYYDWNYGSDFPALTFQLQLYETTSIIRFAYQEMQSSQWYGNGRYASVGVEHQRGFVKTEVAAPGSVSQANHTAVQLTYVVAAGIPPPSLAQANEGGSGQCGVGFGLPAVIVGLGFLLVRRRKA